FYAAAALNGLAIAFFHVVLQNLVGTLSRPEERTRNFGNFSLMGAVANFVGPLLAGVAIDAVGYSLACLVVASQSVIAIALLLVWGSALPPGRMRPPAATTAPRMLVERQMWRMLFFSGLVQLGHDLLQVVVPSYRYSIGRSASMIG